MSDQLKQRLLGATVLVALAVIIVPELVKKPRLDEPGGSTEPADTLAAPAAATADATMPPGQSAPPSGEQDVPLISFSRSSPQPMTTLGQTLAAAAESSSTPPATTIFDNTATPIANSNSQTQTQSNERVESAKLAAPVEPAVPELAVAAATAPATTTPSPKNTPPAGAIDEPEIITPRPVLAPPQPSNLPPLSAPAKVSPTTTPPPIRLLSVQRRSSAPSAANIEQKPAASGWIVQAGSFKVRQNADLLRAKLRAQQFPVSLATVTVAGATLYRVQVGPYDSRDETERVRQRLEQEASVADAAVRRFN